MVDLTTRLQEIKQMVDSGQYFTINRARQYGKTTTLGVLERYLEGEYMIISLDFQGISHASFENENTFVSAFVYELVDAATNNQIFLDFLALSRRNYITRHKRPTFQSVILAGVYDIKNIKRKIRPDAEQKRNRPWDYKAETPYNIAADFLVDMSFSPKDIAGMLADYERDYHTGMDIDEMARFLHEYTSGYPFLVSRLCKLIDERIVGTTDGVDKKARGQRKDF